MLYEKELCDLYLSPNVKVLKLGGLRWLDT